MRGVLIMLAALTAATAAFAPGRVVTERLGWSLPLALWVFIGGVGLAGVVVAVRPTAARRAAILAAIFAAQVAGIGTVAVQRWFAAADAAEPLPSQLGTAVSCALAIVVAGAVGCCVSLGALWREPSSWATVFRPTQRKYLGAGLGIAFGLPLVLGIVFRDFALTTLSQSALTWSFPWGFGLAAAAWLETRAGAIARMTVALSALVTVVGSLVSAFS